MQTVTVRSYTTSKEEAFISTRQYMSKGKSYIYNMIQNNLQTMEKAREVFSLLFSEIISDLYITKFWNRYNQVSNVEKLQLIDTIAEWFCEMGDIMGYCGIVLTVI